MLKSYEAIMDRDRIVWLTEQPDVSSARIIVTVLAGDVVLPVKRRATSTLIAGKGKTLGDIVNPIVDEQDWECLK